MSSHSITLHIVGQVYQNWILTVTLRHLCAISRIQRRCRGYVPSVFRLLCLRFTFFPLHSITRYFLYHCLLFLIILALQLHKFLPTHYQRCSKPPTAYSRSLLACIAALDILLLNVDSLSALVIVASLWCARKRKSAMAVSAEAAGFERMKAIALVAC
jgi:hypothetical protein